MPDISIYVRHTADCKHKGDELWKRCQCRKHLRWRPKPGAPQERRAANTRSWAEAEELKRKLEDELAGRVPVEEKTGKLIEEAITVFLQEKTSQGVGPDSLNKYKRLLKRLRTYCESKKIYRVEGITREVITGHCAAWELLYPSGLTREKNRDKLRSFLRYCYEAKWLERVPAVTKFKVEEPETQPLEPEEYEALLNAIPVSVRNGDPRSKTGSNSGRRGFEDEDNLSLTIRAFLQTMRWSGLAIRDAMTLPRQALSFDENKKLYKILTRRTKTGTPVFVAIPEAVAKEMLSAHKLNSNPKYFFWSGNGKPQSATSNWGQRYIAPVFKLAGLESEGNMVSHRLRDTFAVHLLENAVPMEEVSRALGHKSIRVTEKSYAKWSRGRQDRLDNLIAGTW
jgi:site-specific recombinase XerD